MNASEKSIPPSRPVKSGHVYLCIDLKSFYASVECVERKLDPMTANLVVADVTRTQKTICLAVSPALKAYGIPGRPRLFEVEQKLKAVRRQTGERVRYIAASPRMQLYIDYSARIYETYLKYVSAEDIHVYSIDEVFMDVTHYLSLSRHADGQPVTARQLAKQIIHDVFKATGITATAGIGTNLYLAKVAMDIVAKHVKADADGARIAELDEMRYRQLLWDHRPLTDFWRVGRGIAKRLEKNGMTTMGDVARMSLQGGRANQNGETLLYNEFGIDAELLIDHAWGIEPCTMADIKSYQPSTHSLSSGQVLPRAYDSAQGRLIVQEMVELMAYDLVEKGLATASVTLHIGYDREGLKDSRYDGGVHIDHFGRAVPKPAHGTEKLTDAGGQPVYSSSAKKITHAAMTLYDRIIDKGLMLRRVSVTFNDVASAADPKVTCRQLSLFEEDTREKKLEEQEQKMQQALLKIKRKYGSNAVFKGMNLQDGATTLERNNQIGGHKA
ncbi:DNA methylase [Eubacterium sp. 1001713B170207_170306_E7]|uniref:Y-family DNA polymerase n=1 Tax=Eubacterium sp. 1001713B170207_170306_E7 TaxID=2787097 RepID=UPI0018973BE6|nr:DNA methylase [Eubacterium sp. 1001713B170207_170306_E7]